MARSLVLSAALWGIFASALPAQDENSASRENGAAAPPSGSKPSRTVPLPPSTLPGDFLRQAAGQLHRNVYPPGSDRDKARDAAERRIGYALWALGKNQRYKDKTLAEHMQDVLSQVLLVKQLEGDAEARKDIELVEKEVLGAAKALGLSLNATAAVAVADPAPAHPEGPVWPWLGHGPAFEHLTKAVKSLKGMQAGGKDIKEQRDTLVAIIDSLLPGGKTTVLGKETRVVISRGGEKRYIKGQLEQALGLIESLQVRPRRPGVREALGEASQEMKAAAAVLSINLRTLAQSGEEGNPSAKAKQGGRRRRPRE